MTETHPTAAPEVGQVLTTTAALDALPLDSVLRFDKPGGLVMVKIGPRMYVNGGWSVDVHECLDEGLRVLQVGGQQ